MKNKIIERLPCAEIFKMNQIVQVKQHQVMSLTAYANQSDSFLLFSYDKDEGVSREILQEDSLYCVIEGEIEFEIDEKKICLQSNECIAVSADVPHAMVAKEPSKVLAIHIE